MKKEHSLILKAVLQNKSEKEIREIDKISTIKDVFINVLAGTILPVWYLPEAIQNIIKYTPFAAIYITPLKIYLNQMGTKQQIEALLMQLIWIIILALFGNLLWHMGKKKLVVQGG